MAEGSEIQRNQPTSHVLFRGLCACLLFVLGRKFNFGALT